MDRPGVVLMVASCGHRWPSRCGGLCAGRCGVIPKPSPLCDKALRVVVPVAAWSCDVIGDHRLSRISLAVVIDQSHPTIQDKVVAVLHEHMGPDPLSWAGWALDLRASSASGAVSERWVSLLSLNPRKSPLARFFPLLGSTESLAGTCWRRRRILFPVDALEGGRGGPVLQQRASHGEVLIAEQGVHLRRTHPLLQKPAYDVLVQQVFPILGKRCRMPRIGSSGLRPTKQRYSRL